MVSSEPGTENTGCEWFFDGRFSADIVSFVSGMYSFCKRCLCVSYLAAPEVFLKAFLRVLG